MQFSDTHKNLRGRKLIKYVYERHPYYAICSEMAGDLVDKKILLEIESSIPEKLEEKLHQHVDIVRLRDRMNPSLKSA